MVCSFACFAFVRLISLCAEFHSPLPVLAALLVCVLCAQLLLFFCTATVRQNAKGERALYGRYCEPSELVRAGSAVMYNTKKPALMLDEFKLRVPVYPTMKHNLLFTFYNITVKKSGEPTRAPIAWAFLPLLDSRGRLIADGRHHLLLYDSINSTYMAQTPKSFDKKPLFTIRQASFRCFYLLLSQNSKQT